MSDHSELIAEARQYIPEFGGAKLVYEGDLIDRLATALSTAQGEVEARWRPIATAPLDGTHVLLAFGEDTVAEGWWEDADGGAYPWKFLDCGCPGSEFANGERLIGSREVRGGPSHWQPKPAAPARPTTPPQGGDGT